MSWDSFSAALLGLPPAVKWTLAALGILLGLPMMLWPGRIVRGLRRWLMMQLRWIRRPGYRRMLKIYGWLLFVCGALLMILLALTGGR